MPALGPTTFAPVAAGPGAQRPTAPRAIARPQLSQGAVRSATAPPQRLKPYAQSILDRFDHAPVEPSDSELSAELARFRPTLVKMLTQYGDPASISQAPKNVRATLYAITQLGDAAYGVAGTVTDPQMRTAGPGFKCNIFASKCWARGAGIGYNRNGENPLGYPTPYAGLPPVATDISSRHYNMPNFTHTSTPRVGDIFAFNGGTSGPGHSGLYLGGKLGIYAGDKGVKLGTLPYIQAEDGYPAGATFRTYTPGR